MPHNENKDKQSNTELTDKQNITESSPLTANKESGASQCENANVQQLFRPFSVNTPETECSNPENPTVNMQNKCLPDKNSSCETHSSRGHVSRSTQRGGARRACSLSVNRSDNISGAGNQATKNPGSAINKQIGSKNRKPAINKQVTRESGNSQDSKNRSTPNSDTNNHDDGQGP